MYEAFCFLLHVFKFYVLFTVQFTQFHIIIYIMHIRNWSVNSLIPRLRLQGEVA